jgi:hypothetical protein
VLKVQCTREDSNRSSLFIPKYPRKLGQSGSKSQRVRPGRILPPAAPAESVNPGSPFGSQIFLIHSRRTSHATFSLRARLRSLCALPPLRFRARQTRTGSVPPGPLSLDESPRGAAPLAPRCVLFFLAFAATRMACDWSRFCRLVLAAVEPGVGRRLAAQPLVPVPGSNLRRAILPSWF